MERVATYNHQNTLVQYMMKAEAKVAAEQVRSASGLNSTDYKGIASDSGRLVNLKAITAGWNSISTRARS